MLPLSVADRIQTGPSSMSLLLTAAAERATKVNEESSSKGSTIEEGGRQRNMDNSDSEGSTQVGADASGVPPSVYIRASKTPQETASPSNSGASSVSTDQSYAKMLEQLLQPPVPRVHVPQPPAADSGALVHAIAALLNGNQPLPRPPQQPNPAHLTLELLQLLGNGQPRAPTKPASESVPSFFEIPRTTCEPINVYPGQGSDIPGSKRVSCRARGMPPDHCSESAYFWIHPDMPHGGDLLCSYPGCRESGVKFRYCKVCKVPAAKRSFLFRHGHSLRNQPVRESPAVTSDAEVSCSGSVGSETPGKVQTTASDSSTLAENQESLKSTSPSLVSRESGANSKKRRLDTMDSESTESSMTTSSENSRTARWRELLNERPEDNDEDKMSLWLMRVMQVSDMRGTLKMDAPRVTACQPCVTTTNY